MNILEEDYAPLAEIRDILDNKRKKYKKEGMEMLYEQKQALDHAQRFSHLNLRDSRGLMKKLSELDLNLNPTQIVKIVDLLPETVDDIRAIFAKERFRYNEEEIQRILDLIAQYR